MFFDSTFLLVIPVLIFAMWAQSRVRGTYRKFLQVPAQRGLTGAEAARRVLDAAGLHDVPIHQVDGVLTDHYHPGKRALFLSAENYHGRSVAALGVACHEAGHALQHARRYVPLTIRQAIWPVAGFGGNLAFPLFFLGFLFQLPMLMDIGIIVFAVAAFFAIVTLPVEFDASNRAMRLLVHHGLVTQQESGQVKQVLGAAALTYVAGALMAVVQLVRMLVLRGRD